MEKRLHRSERGWALVQSLFLFTLGLACIALGLSFVPVVGILAGAALMSVALYPWMGFFRPRRVSIIVGGVSDNYLGSRWFAVAILSARQDRDGFDFDPRWIDPGSVRFGPHKSRPMENMSDPAIYNRNLVDINGDGTPDLILYFSGDESGVTSREKEACVRARTRGGGRIIGCGEVSAEFDMGSAEPVGAAV